MNLIEQLGGYEKAKACLDTPTARECVNNELRSALLEYRRENNIFEVGDYIVDKVSNQFFRIIKVDGCNLLIEQMFWVNSLYQRHATPAEIQAGKRLN